jgi:hypothetical protein
MSSLTGKDEFAIGNEELRVGDDSPSLEVAKDEPTLVALDRHGRPVFFRSTILVVSVCAFTAPGIWSAMNGLGVGCSLSPDLVNGANAILYAFMTVTCFAGPWMTNLIGFRWTLAISSLGYPLYAARLYVNNRYGTTWFTFRNFGSIIGGAISLGINHKTNHKGKVGYQTYLGFIAIQCLGFFSGLLLSNPEKVQRDDGTRIQAPRGIHWRTEGKEMWRLVTSKSILLLLPLFWYFGWIQAYPGTYFATYFTVRSRALGSFLSAVVMTLSTWIGGTLVDLPWPKSRQGRALTTYGLIASLNSATWIWAVYIQNEYRHTKPVLDWADQKAFDRGFGLYMFECISLGMLENFIYWCIGNLSDSPGDQIRYSALLRGIETAAVAVGFGVQAVPTQLVITAGINFGFWFIALPFGYYATLQVVRKFDELDRKRNDETMAGEDSEKVQVKEA